MRTLSWGTNSSSTSAISMADDFGRAKPLLPSAEGDVG